MLHQHQLQRCVSLLGLTTPRRHGLYANATERYGLRCIGWDNHALGLQRALGSEIVKETCRLTWAGDLKWEDEAFLNTILHRADKNGSGFFMSPRYFARFVDMQRRTQRLC